MANKSSKSKSRKSSPRSKGKSAGSGGTVLRASRETERGVIDNIWGIGFIVCGIFLFAAMRFHAAGQVGNVIGDFLKGIFGHIGLFLPFYLILFGILLLLNKAFHVTPLTALLASLILLMLCIVNSGRFIPAEGIAINAKGFYAGGKALTGGGLFGMAIGSLLIRYIGKVGLFCLAIAIILACLLFMIGIPLSHLGSALATQHGVRSARVEEKRKIEAERAAALEKEREKRREEARAEVRKRAAERDRQEREYRSRELSRGIEYDLADVYGIPPESLFSNQQARPVSRQSASSVRTFRDTAYERDAYDSGSIASLFQQRDQKNLKQEPAADGRAQHFVNLMEDPKMFGYHSTPAAPATTVKRGRRQTQSTVGIENQRVERSGFGLDGYDGFPDMPPGPAQKARSGFDYPPITPRKTPATPAYQGFTAADDTYMEPAGPERVRPEVPVTTPAPTPKPRIIVPETSASERPATTIKTPGAPKAAATNGGIVKPPAPLRSDKLPEEKAATGKPAHDQAKMSGKEAEQAMLSTADFSNVKKTVNYQKPPITLLKEIKNEVDGRALNASLAEKAETLERTLHSFNVAAHVVEVTQGPAVTRFEVQPEVGVKVSKISGLADDIKLNLCAKSIRIEAPIPGKAAVGIEIENEKVSPVTLREIISSKEFQTAKSKISFAVGRDIAGKAIVADLKSMPHLLIAGSTGSGKSVCINSIITSILYKADPDEVKLVLIDPKVVELGDYNGIPHLLIPVVTEPSKAAAALNWAVAEMTDRYKKFAEAKARDLKGYNEHKRAEGKEDEVLPQIVIIIDELADLMMAAPSQVEEAICRLAQLARAAGMHLIVATQRPSVDIITGLIKANIPSRIAFAVASQFDSRTILDMSGAEKLVGKGDMLYNPLGMGKPIRVQGCFISDEEIRDVIDFVKSQAEVEYDHSVLDSVDRGNAQQQQQQTGNEEDELLDEALEFVISQEQASTSRLQRRFRIGYNRAANLMEALEDMGAIGPQDGSKPRQVLWGEADLAIYRNGGQAAVNDDDVEDVDLDVGFDETSDGEDTGFLDE